MKTAILALALAVPSIAADHTLDNTATMSLAVDQKELTVLVSYPGPTISGVCAIDIVADSYGRRVPVKNLLDVLEFRKAFERDQPLTLTVASDKVLRIPLHNGGFSEGAVISTKDGSTLKAAIERALGPDRKVVLMPRSC